MGTQPTRTPICASRPTAKDPSPTQRHHDAATRQHLADSRDRSVGRPPSNHDSALGERRIVPRETQDQARSGRLATLRSRALAGRQLDEPHDIDTPATTPTPRATPALMRAPDVTRITGLSRTSIYRMECAGRFPQRVQLSSNSVAWRKADVVAWINSRPNGRPLRIDQL